MGLVLATSPCNQSQGLVTSSELAIFAPKSKIKREGSSIFGTSPCDLLHNTLHVNCSWDKSLPAISPFV